MLWPTIMGEGAVNRGLKWLVGYLASMSAGFRYCSAHTATGANTTGASAEKIEAIWEYETSPLYSEKELAALQQAQRREQRQIRREQHDHSPAFALDLKPGGRPAAPHKAANRHISENRRALEEQDRQETASKKKGKPVNLIDAFTRAAGSDDDGDDGGGAGGNGPKPPTKPKGPDRPHRRPRRTRRRDKDFDRGM